VHASLDAQALTATSDSLGLCIFGRSVTNVQIEFITNALNDALNSSLDSSFFRNLGVETLRLENEFNYQAGFAVNDDDLPEFFYKEALEPTNKLAPFNGSDVKRSAEGWWQENPAVW